MEIPSNFGWRFDNSYARLGGAFYTRLAPTPVREPRLVVVNYSLARELGLELSSYSDEQLSQFFSGNQLPPGESPLAQAYAGHQFGYFTLLGDGRAHLIGEQLTPKGERFDIQLKGSGRTPYSRRGDGRAALAPMLREYIVSEAMYALGIPTTRSLAVVTTGESVYRERPLPGAILTRVAASHIRIGTFQYFAVKGDSEALATLTEYSLKRHYPNCLRGDCPALSLLSMVVQSQAKLVAKWLALGFIHGVLNTDNVAISGETIDYGPCAFIDTYDPGAVFSSIDHGGRYAYSNQPAISEWNLARFAEALLLQFSERLPKKEEQAREIVGSFASHFNRAWASLMRKKLGLLNEEEQDLELIGEFLQWMERRQADYTNSFRRLVRELSEGDSLFEDGEFAAWYHRWQERLTRNEQPPQASYAMMRNHNPSVIPRNRLVERVLNAANEGDFGQMMDLLAVLERPYEDNINFPEYQQPPKPEERVCQTFCGT